MSQEQYHANQFTKKSLIPQYKVPPKKKKKRNCKVSTKHFHLSTYMYGLIPSHS